RRGGLKSGLEERMSAIGTKRTFQPRPQMSAFGGKADIIQRKADIKNDPKRTSADSLTSFL
ncbi:MAG: hypothetical protein WAK90_14845, partial [Pseudolabrys sp.]